MPARDTKIRIAKPTSDLKTISQMYVDGLGYEKIASFENHDGVDGIMIGHPQHLYHFEFTQHKGADVPFPSHPDNLIIFYMPDIAKWQKCCSNMLTSGFIEVKANNSYWDKRGKTFVDIDGYRVVIQNQEWND